MSAINDFRVIGRIGTVVWLYSPSRKQFNDLEIIHKMDLDDYVEYSKMYFMELEVYGSANWDAPADFPETEADLQAIIKAFRANKLKAEKEK